MRGYISHTESKTIRLNHLNLLVKVHHGIDNEEKGMRNMQITDVKIRKVTTEGRMKALASITLDQEFVVHDLRIIEGSTGLFVAMPSKRTPEGIFRDIAHPINGDMRQKVEAAVLEAYGTVDVSTYEAQESYNGINE